jgi:hypothetical protein
VVELPASGPPKHLAIAYKRLLRIRGGGAIPKDIGYLG